ncbi:MAG: DUF4249 domain-containing protein [Mucilaginibacter sp.]
MKNKILFIIVIFIFIVSCKKPFAPAGIQSATGFLVVEGVIDPGNDTTRFKLSRVVKLDTITAAPVTNALVFIEGMDNSTSQLNGNAAGIYSLRLSLDNSQKYRLHIKAADGKDYKSDYVDIKITPGIDAINYKIKNNELQISLDTHDETNNTRYYRWNYIETWQFHSRYESTYVSNGDSVIARRADQQVYFCYANDNSNSILLGSSARLTKDVISAAPIVFIPPTSERIEKKYSILVNQYALTSDAYNFWENIKKNTEELGSIFDAQPSEIAGNIHCTTNPEEPVIGYVSASTFSSKRIFIDNSSLPTDWKPVYPYNCPTDSVFLEWFNGKEYINQENQVFNYKKGGYSEIPITAIKSKKNGLGHLGAAPVCVDCTLRGTLKKPSFWQ